MIWKAIKFGTLTAGMGLVAGGLVLGGDLGSYLRSSCRSVQVSIKDNIPVEFQLRRARDLLDSVGPELHENVRRVAEQEVDIASLKSDLDQSRQSLADERHRVQTLRNCLSSAQTSFTFNGIDFTRDQVERDLGRQFAHFREAEAALTARERLLESRQQTLAAAMEAMESAKAQKATLEAQVEGLEAQYRVVQAASSGTQFQLDGGRLAEAQKVVGEIRKQLEVTEHVLAHEAKFTQPIPVDAIDEKDLLQQVDARLAQGDPQTAAAADVVAAPPAR
jgi:DNA repair exonuclease SbcCD ATPase subunit